MVSVIPFLPSFRWYAVWWRVCREGKPESVAVATANSETGTSGKDFARTVMRGTDSPTLLSIPIVGGSAALKREHNIPSALLSEHGNWRHSHIGTLETIYGRYPYSGEILALIRDCYAADEPTLTGFNSTLHHAVTSFLPSPALLREDVSPAAAERGREVLEKVMPDISIIDALMRHGPETTLALLAHSTK
ncbi:MAG: WbqC family protein [Muribaculaceae bacterium]|nr:WbqC family protein [Muribaculaceae bacterium]